MKLIAEISFWMFAGAAGWFAWYHLSGAMAEDRREHAIRLEEERRSGGGK